MSGPVSAGSTSNSTLLQQAQAAAGSTVTGASTVAPATTITDVPAGATIYSGGGVTSPTGIANQSGIPFNNKANGTATSTSKVTTQTVEQWLNYFYTNIAGNATSLRQFVSEASLAGLVNTNASQEQAYAAWQKLVVQSYNHTINGQQISPWDVLANSIPVTPTGTGTSKGGGGSGSFSDNAGQSYLQGLTNSQVNSMVQEAQNAAASNSTKNSVTDVDINYTDPDTARYILNQTYQQYLGRAPSNAEISAFTKALNLNEKEFPKESTSTFTPAPGTADSGTSIPVPESGSTGTTVVGYDSNGNPIMGPSTTVGDTNSAPGTETTTSLGEQDYTRYGRQQLATDYAQANPSYGAYQAAGPLFQAFLAALKPAVSGVGSNT